MDAMIYTGDTFTIAGVYRAMPNPNRHWWQFWRPRFVASNDLQTFMARHG